MKLYKELIELVASAGPLHWVMHEDADTAKVWEIKASALLASIKEEEMKFPTIIEELELLINNYETTGTSLTWLYDGVLALTIKYKEKIVIPESVLKDSIETSNKKVYKPSCVEDGCWWECVKCGANSTSPFSEHKVTFRGPECDGIVTKRSSIRRTPIKDLGTLEFSDGLDD